MSAVEETKMENGVAAHHISRIQKVLVYVKYMEVQLLLNLMRMWDTLIPGRISNMSLCKLKRKKRTIIIVYNSLNKQSDWLPEYMKDYKEEAHPFWIKNLWGEKIGDYQYIKKALGYE